MGEWLSDVFFGWIYDVFYTLQKSICYLLDFIRDIFCKLAGIETVNIRYRKNAKNVMGHPDIVFLRAQIAVFCDGSLWHGYEWDKKKEQIKTNRDYWIPKIERNMERDFNYTEELIEQGWLVLRFWDFEIKEDVKACADKIELALKNRIRK